MPRKLTIACALTLGLLTGCNSNTPDSAPKVVSLQTSGGTAQSTASAAAPAAPIIRPDTTSVEEARMRQPWMQCLKKRGLPMQTTEDGLLDLDAKGDSTETNGRLLAEKPENEKACGKLRPVLAPELDEDKNPYYADDDENYNKCLVEHGDPLIKKDGKWQPGPGWNDWPPDEAMELACQATAFDGKRG